PSPCRYRPSTRLLAFLWFLPRKPFFPARLARHPALLLLNPFRKPRDVGIFESASKARPSLLKTVKSGRNLHGASPEVKEVPGDQDKLLVCLKFVVRPDIIATSMLVGPTSEASLLSETRVLVILSARKHFVYAHRVNELAVASALVVVCSS